MDDFFAKLASAWDKPEHVAITRVFVNALLPLAGEAAHGDVLDFGCGTGVVGLSLAAGARSVILNDTSPAMLKALREKLAGIEVPNVTVREGALAALPRESVDLIVSNMAFHHVADIPAALAQFRRLCRPGGRVVVGDLMPEDGGFHAPKIVPHNGFDPAELGALFTAAGFRLGAVKPRYNVMRKPGLARDFAQFAIQALG